MDEDLAELERRAAANPADAGAAARLDRSLLRAGRTEDAVARYRFKFRCPLRFDDLELGPDPEARHCSRCERAVHLVHTPTDLAERVARGDCVAFARSSLASACVSLAQDSRTHSAEEPVRPCVQDADIPFVQLDELEIPRLTLNALPSSFAHAYSVVPVSWDERGPRLRIVCASFSSASMAVQDLSFMLNVDVQLVLAKREAVERALERYYPPSELADDGEFIMGEFFVDV
jgi:hypothetical protein